MVHPDYRRKGIFAEMGRYAAQRVKEEKGLFMTAFPIRKETIGGLLKIGWEVVGELPVLVYPLRFRGIVNRYLHFSPLSFLMGGVEGEDIIFSGDGEGRKRRKGFNWKRSPNSMVDSIDSGRRRSKLYPVMGARDRAFLNWRYLKNPIRNYTLYRATENGEMTGYLILRKVDLLQFNSALWSISWL